MYIFTSYLVYGKVQKNPWQNKHNDFAWRLNVSKNQQKLGAWMDVPES